jgi:hypothetical protein
MIHLRLGKGGRRVDVTFAESTGEAKATPSQTKATTGSAHDPKPATKATDQGRPSRHRQTSTSVSFSRASLRSSRCSQRWAP